MRKFSVPAVIAIFVLVLGNFALAQNHPFTDTFDDASLAQWLRGSNSGSTYVKTVSVNGQNVLELQSQPSQSGWLISKNNYILRNSAVTMKIVTANKDGDLGISPTYNLADSRGIDPQPNWYRFYVGPDPNNQASAYGLYVTKKNDGTKEDLKATGAPSTPFYLRMRFDDYKIYFEFYTTNPNSPTLVHDEFFDLPGYTLDDRFYYEIAATNTAVNGKLQVDDFATVKDNSTAEKEILVDALTSSTFVNGANDPNQSLRVDRTYVGLNTNFSASGWKPTADADLVRYDLGHYLEKGSLEITVTQFEPRNQNTMDRHHVLAMFRMPWGSHHVVEDLETDWDLHTGKFYSIPPDVPGVSGVKLYSVTHLYSQTDFDEKQSVTPRYDAVYAPQHDWNRNTQYTIKMVWSDKRVAYYRNKVLQKAEETSPGIFPDIVHSHTKDFELRYVYVGRDRTVSGDIATNYNGEYGTNGTQYKAMWSNGQSGKPNGPIYSNIKVKEVVSATDLASPIITIASPTTYVNGARLSWTTNELAVCYVNYGTTAVYGSKTPVLGPPSSSYSTLLADLASNQTYHYQIVAVDNAGNKTVSGDQTFITQQSGTYVFKPVADTYIEQNNNVTGYSHLYGITRASGNYGWMNLMTAKGRICFIKFNVTGVTGAIDEATLQLYGRQGGNSGGNLKTFTPKVGHESDWEFNLTWNNQSTYIQSLNAPITSINSVTAGQWHPLSVTTVFQGNGNYYFALEGTGTDPVSFDSGESNNHQPELIVTQPAFTEVPTALPGLYDPVLAWGDYDRDGDPDIVLNGSSAVGTIHSAVWRNGGNGTFVNINAPLQAVYGHTVAWGDYDKNNFLDILLSGYDLSTNKRAFVYKNALYDNGTGPNPVNYQLAYTLYPASPEKSVWVDYDQDGDLDIAFVDEIYENTGSNFVNKNFAIPRTYNGNLAWGDYDNDGDLDLLVTGDQNDIAVTKIYRNDLGPNGRTFVDIAASLVGFDRSAAAWGDYDKDGDLDILVSGMSNNARTTKLYRNNTATTNNLPAKPTKPTPDTITNGSNVTLRWNPSTDAETGVGLTYNITMGVNVDGVATVSPMSMTSNGRRLIPAPGNVGSNTSWTLSTLGLPVGTYHWKVQAVDQTFKGSIFSNDGMFTIGSPKTAGTDSLADRDSTAIAHAIPETFALSQNYPNPFNPTTRLNLNLPENGHVKAMVYDLTGQEVRRLQDAEMTAGYRYLDWDGKNTAGTTVSSGAYLVKVVFEGVSGFRKEIRSRVTLLK